MSCATRIASCHRPRSARVVARGAQEEACSEGQSSSARRMTRTVRSSFPSARNPETPPRSFKASAQAVRGEADDPSLLADASLGFAPWPDPLHARAARSNQENRRTRPMKPTILLHWAPDCNPFHQAPSREHDLRDPGRVKTVLRLLHQEQACVRKMLKGCVGKVVVEQTVAQSFRGHKGVVGEPRLKNHFVVLDGQHQDGLNRREQSSTPPTSLRHLKMAAV